MILLTAAFGILKYGREFFSTLTLSIFVLTGVVILGYLWFFGMSVWVYLYDDRLEIRLPLSKLIEDRFGLSLSQPKVIYYREIKALRKTHGLGGYNALVIVKEVRPWQRSEFGIPYLTLENYADLESELLQRVPPTCELYSVNFRGRRGPFK